MKDGRVKDGHRYYQRAFHVFQQTGGEDDLDFAHTCYQLARSCLFGENDYTSAQ